MSKVVAFVASLLLLLSLALQGCGDNLTGTPISAPSTTKLPPATTSAPASTKLPPVTTTSTTGKPSSCPQYLDSSPGKGLARVDVMPVGKSATTGCTTGYAGNTVNCTDIGVFNPAPSCTVIEDYCLASSRNNAETPVARLGETVQVTCTEVGYVPEHANAVCNIRGALEPRPFCTSATTTTSTTTTTGVRRALRGGSEEMHFAGKTFSVMQCRGGSVYPTRIVCCKLDGRLCCAKSTNDGLPSIKNMVSNPKCLGKA